MPTPAPRLLPTARGPAGARQRGIGAQALWQRLDGTGTAISHHSSPLAGDRPAHLRHHAPRNLHDLRPLSFVSWLAARRRGLRRHRDRPWRQPCTAQASADNTLTAAETGRRLEAPLRRQDHRPVARLQRKRRSRLLVGRQRRNHRHGGEGGDLVTVDQYADFELAVDFKVGQNGNSGIFYRGVESPKSAIYYSAPEYQVLDNDGHPDAKNGPDRFSGANYDLIRRSRERLPPGRRVELREDPRPRRTRRALAERQEDGRLRVLVTRVEGQGRDQQVQGVAGLRHGQERPHRRSRITATPSRSRTSRCGS